MKKYLIIGVLTVSALGTLFHFIYRFVPLFIFPHNESIFEHTKLIIFPFLIYYLVSWHWGKELFASYITAILIACIFVVSSYYTYIGMLGQNFDFLNIAIYYSAVIIGFSIIGQKKSLFDKANSVIFGTILLILVLLFTYYPLDVPFFNS